MRALVVALVCVASVAQADTLDRIEGVADRARDALDDAGIDREITLRIARAGLARVRRSIAVGPHLGAYQQLDVKDGANGFGLSFGLGLYTFDVPSGIDVKDLVTGMVKDEIKARLSNGETTISARDIIDRVVTQVIEGRRSTWHPPKLSIVLEGFTTFGDADAFGARGLVGYGISKLSIGLAASVQRANSETTALLGPELAVRLTPIGENRTPVIDLFARYDVGMGDARSQTIAFGGRFLLDAL